MTNLTNQLPESTYGDLITTTNSGQGLPPITPVPVQDGLGNNSPITMSQSVVNITRTGGNSFELDGIPLTVSAATLNNISIQAFLQTTDNAYHTIISTVIGLDLLITATITAIKLASPSHGACTPSPVSAYAVQTVAGIYELAGTPTITFNDSLGGVSAQWVISGNLLELQVRGPAVLQTINWNVIYQYVVF